MVLINQVNALWFGDDLHLDIEKAKENGLNTIFVNSKNLNVENLDLCVVNDISCELVESI